jgi:hypothetical protein
MALWASGDASPVVPLRRHVAPPFPATPPSPSLLYPAAPPVLRARGPPSNSACCKEDGVGGGELRRRPLCLSPSLPWPPLQSSGHRSGSVGPRTDSLGWRCCCRWLSSSAPRTTSNSRAGLPATPPATRRELEGGDLRRQPLPLRPTRRGPSLSEACQDRAPSSEDPRIELPPRSPASL